MKDGHSSLTGSHRGTLTGQDLAAKPSPQEQGSIPVTAVSSSGKNILQKDSYHQLSPLNSTSSSPRVSGATRTSILLRNYSSSSVSTVVRVNGTSTSPSKRYLHPTNENKIGIPSPEDPSHVSQGIRFPLDEFGVKPTREVNGPLTNEAFGNAANVVKVANLHNSKRRDTLNSVYDSLDSSQLAVVTHDPNVPTLVEAGPGSGKTQTIVHRLAFLLHEHRVQPHQILVVCFTRQAAEALRQRLHHVLLCASSENSLGLNTPIPPNSVSVNPAFFVKIKTLHAFGLECLRRFGVVGAETEVYDVMKQKKLVRRLVDQYGLYNKGPEVVEDLLQYISTVKRSTKWTEGEALANQISGVSASLQNEALETAEGVRGGGSQPRDEPFYTHDKQMVHLFARYQQALREEHAIDFDDLQYMFYQTLKPLSSSMVDVSSPRNSDTPPSLVAHRLRSEISHILVDEFQDLNEIQFEILAQLAGESCRVTCVGDPHQCIYGWRGALPNVFSRWAKRFPKTVYLSLAMNYRSTPALVDLTNAFVKGRKQRSYLELSNIAEAEREKGVERTALVMECISTFGGGRSDSLPSTGGADASAGGLSLNHPDFSLATCQAVRYVIEEMLRRQTPLHLSGNGYWKSTPLVYGDIAVLCRTRKTVKELITFLEQYHIPVQELKSGPLACAPVNSSNPLVFAQALIAYLRCCLSTPSNEDVELALCSGPNHRIADRQQKRFFFDLHATSVMMRDEVTSGSNSNTLMSCIQDVGLSPSTHYGLSPTDPRFVSNYFMLTDKKVSSASLSFPYSFYSVIQQMVFHQFDPQRFPKLHTTKPTQKVLNKFLQCTAYARDLLYRSASVGQHAENPIVSLKEEALSSLHSSATIVKEVLQFIVTEAGFDSDRASNIFVQHKKRRLASIGEKRQRGSLHVNQHAKVSYSANLVAEVANSLSTSEASNHMSPKEAENDLQVVEEEQQLCITRLLLDTCMRVEHTVEMELDRLVAVKVEGGNEPGCRAMECSSAEVSDTSMEILVPSPSLLLSRVLDEFTDQILAIEENCGNSDYDKRNEDKDPEAALESMTADDGKTHHEKGHSSLRPLGKVTVGTAHSSKGLEWPAVIIPYCCEGAYPVSSHPEERRVFYVALTRARKYLFLLTSSLGQLIESASDETSSKEENRKMTASLVTRDQGSPSQLHSSLQCSAYLRELKGHYDIVSLESLRRQQLETHNE